MTVKASELESLMFIVLGRNVRSLKERNELCKQM